MAGSYPEDLIVPWIDEKHRRTADDWKTLATQFDALADKAAPAGMRVAASRT